MFTDPLQDQVAVAFYQGQANALIVRNFLMIFLNPKLHFQASLQSFGSAVAAFLG